MANLTDQPLNLIELITIKSSFEHSSSHKNEAKLPTLQDDRTSHIYDLWLSISFTEWIIGEWNERYYAYFSLLL